ncbi:unnamed protein product [Lota lota]
MSVKDSVKLGEIGLQYAGTVSELTPGRFRLPTERLDVGVPHERCWRDGGRDFQIGLASIPWKSISKNARTNQRSWEGVSPNEKTMAAPKESAIRTDDSQFGPQRARDQAENSTGTQPLVLLTLKDPTRSASRSQSFRVSIDCFRFASQMISSQGLRINRFQGKTRAQDPGGPPEPPALPAAPIWLTGLKHLPQNQPEVAVFQLWSDPGAVRTCE